MRFLRIFGFGFVFANGGGKIILAETGGDGGARIVQRFRRHVDSVGPHIGDQAGRLTANIDPLIKPLCGTHGASGIKAEFARCFLLQG